MVYANEIVQKWINFHNETIDYICKREHRYQMDGLIHKMKINWQRHGKKTEQKTNNNTHKKTTMEN